VEINATDEALVLPAWSWPPGRAYKVLLDANRRALHSTYLKLAPQPVFEDFHSIDFIAYMSPYIIYRGCIQF